MLEKELSLGYASGNRVDVVLRNIDAAGDSLEAKKKCIEIGCNGISAERLH
jgi:hypothetical protein